MKRIYDELAKFQNDIPPSGHSLKSYTSRMRACKEQFATLVCGISHLFCINVFSSVAIGVCLAYTRRHKHCRRCCISRDWSCWNATLRILFRIGRCSKDDGGPSTPTAVGLRWCCYILKVSQLAFRCHQDIYVFIKGLAAHSFME